jgi:hypothetical protein
VTHDDATARIDGRIREWGRPDERLEMNIDVADLQLDETIGATLEISELPPAVIDVWRELEPRGRLDAHVTVRSDGDGETVEARLRPRGVTLRGVPGLTYPLRNVHGVVRLADDDVTIPWASARAGSLRVEASGDASAEGLGTLRLSAKGLPVDRSLRSVLQTIVPEVDEVWERMQPQPGGVADVLVERTRDDAGAIRHAVVVENPRLRLRPDGRHRTITTGGRVEMRFPSGEVVVDRLAGRHNDAAFVLSGGTPVEGGAPVWNVTSDPLWPNRDLCGILPEEFCETLEDTAGGRIAVDPLRFTRTGTEVRLDGSRLVFYPEGGKGLELRGGVKLVSFAIHDDGTVRARALADGLGLEAGVPLESLRGKVNLDVTLGDAPTVTGEIRDLNGRLWKRSLAGAKAKVSLRDGLLRLDDVRGDLDGGVITGKVRVSLRGDGGLRLTTALEDVPLNRFLAEEGSLPDPEVSGRLDAELRLTKDGPSLDRLDGKGKVKVRDAALWDVPFFSAIFGALSAIPPIKYKPVFHSADVEFDVDGDALRIEAMEFRSDLVSLERGRGTISLFGDVDLVLVPKVRTIDIPGLSDIWSLIKTGLMYRLRIRGTLDRPSASLEALPFLHGGPDDAPRVVPEFLGKIRKKKGLGL